MNKLEIIGNVTRDPESRTTKAGKTVCSFSVAVNGRKRDDGTQDTTFFQANAWGKTGETCSKYLAKGSKVYLEGPVSVSTYDGKDGKTHASLDVMVNTIEFLNRVDRDANDNVEESAAPAPVEDDDCPF